MAKYKVTPIDTECVDTNKAFEEEPMQIQWRSVAREFRNGDRPDSCAGTLPLDALKAIISIAASHSPEFSLMHVDVSRAYFHAKAQKPVLVKLPAEDCSGLARASRKLELPAGAQFKKPVPQQSDDFVATGTKGSELELKKQLENVYPIKASIIGQVLQRVSKR